MPPHREALFYRCKKYITETSQINKLRICFSRKDLMKLTLEKKTAHGGYPVMRWMADNIFIHIDSAGNIKADKEKVHTED